MLRTRSLAILLFVLSAALAFAQQEPPRPNFTGIWNLDKSKSDFGGLPVPDSARYLIRHLGSKVEMQYEEGTHTTRVDVVPDGQEHVLETLPESENVARVYWSGSTLVFEGRIKPLANSDAPMVKYTSHWTLSPDRKVFTIDRQMSSQRASVHQTVVFLREPVKAKGQ